MDCLVVGAGEMGRWAAETLDPGTVAFADVDRETAQAAVDRTDRPRTSGDRNPATLVPIDGDSTHDVVVIAVPMSAAADAIATEADRAREAIVDVTGSMTDPLAAMADHAPDRQRASFHPLFAPENGPGTIAAVVESGGAAIEWVRERFRAAGCELLETTASDHDRAMETVQSGAHAAVLAYALAAEAVPDGMATPVSAGLADLVATVTGNDPAIYAEIQAAYGSGADAVAAAADELARADADRFEALYDAAGDSPILAAADDVAGTDPGDDDVERTDVEDGGP